MKAVMDRIFIELDQNNKTNHGILLPASIERPKTTGKVVAIGPEVKSVQIGDEVLFHVFDELQTIDPKIVVVRENSILGIIEE